MIRYSDYQKDKDKNIDLTKEELKSIDFTKFKIIVPTNKYKEDLINAFKTFHDEGFDSDVITCNQLAHEYLNGKNIIVNEELFKSLN